MSLSSRIDRVLQGNPEGLEAFQQLSLAEMAETRVTFGKTHVGKTYEELWNQEKGWIKWFCKTYQDSNYQGRTPQVADLCRKEGGTSRTGTRAADFDRANSSTRDRPTSQQSHAKGQVCIESTNGDRDFGRHEHQRGDLGTVGCDHANGWSRIDLSTGEHRSLADTSSQYRERLDGDSHVDPPSELSGPVDPICMAGDFDWDFRDNTLKANIMNQRQRTFNKLVQQISQELQEVSDSVGRRHEPVIQVLEVFCGPQSELTKQTSQLGYRACRFGLQEGDLSTTVGRKLLFQKVITSRPQHLWYSPTCGPWCSWSHLNEA